MIGARSRAYQITEQIIITNNHAIMLLLMIGPYAGVRQSASSEILFIRFHFDN